MILDICAALGAILEPEPSGVAVEALDAEPLTWEAGKLYVYPIRVDEEPFETGPSRRQVFDLSCVFVTSNLGEEARQKRSPDLASTLDGKRGAYLEAVRTNQSGPPWGMLRGRSDTTSPRMLDKRSAAIQVSGWRVIGG